MSLIIKIVLSELTLLFSVASKDKTQWFVHLSFNLILQLINGISSDLQGLLKYINGTAIFALNKIVVATFEAFFYNNLALYLKDLKLLSFAISLLKSDVSSLE